VFLHIQTQVAKRLKKQSLTSETLPDIKRVHITRTMFEFPKLYVTENGLE
jgi:hypothetical protein